MGPRYPGTVVLRPPTVADEGGRRPAHPELLPGGQRGLRHQWKPFRLGAGSDDRHSIRLDAKAGYRIDELQNVTAELREHPVTGLGLGGQWVARHPLGVEHEKCLAGSVAAI